MSRKCIIVAVTLVAGGWLQYASAAGCGDADKPCTEPVAAQAACPGSSVSAAGCPGSAAAASGGCPGAGASSGGCPGSSSAASACPASAAAAGCPHARAASCPHSGCDQCPVSKARCPISGKPADKEQAVDYKGGKVYLCCGGCPAPFKEDTAKFAAKANHQLITTGQARLARCPLSGRPLNPETVLEIGGVEVAFCCNGCKGRASELEGDEQIVLVFGDVPFARGFQVRKAQTVGVH